jgi:predicted esterase
MSQTTSILRVAILPALLATALAQEGTLPYPSGTSGQHRDGLDFQLVVPAGLEPDVECSLLMILHGYGGSATGMASGLSSLSSEGFVVFAPKSTGDGWDESDLGKVKSILQHLLEVFTVGESRLHGAGFSNGGWNLGPIALDEELPFASACWIAAGYRGGKVPKDARERLGALALAGSEDGNRDAAEATVTALGDKVRSVECRLQPGLGHEWPRELMPYYFWWLGRMEGRYDADQDLSFEWRDDVEAAKAEMKENKRAGLIWFHDPADGEDEKGDALYLQRVVWMHPQVRFFAGQLVLLCLERAAHQELFDSFRLKQTPALVVLKPSFKKLKVLKKRVPPEPLAKLLRAVSPVQEMPE